MISLLAALSIALAFGVCLWLVSLRLRDASIVDIFWGPMFAAMAWLVWWLQGDVATLRQTLVPVLVTCWSVRLAAHIARRNHGKGEDPRYRAMRAAHGAAFWWRSLFIVFLLQAVIAWFVALPLWWAIASPAPAFPTVLDLLGLGTFTVGLIFESVADWQLVRFKASPANRGRVLDTGLWRYSRHPNYFGDALLWWGLFLLAAATPGGWMTVLSPVSMTVLLLKVSGVALLERSLVEAKPGYRAYVARTSAFIPRLPRRAGADGGKP